MCARRCAQAWTSSCRCCVLGVGTRATICARVAACCSSAPRCPAVRGAARRLRLQVAVSRATFRYGACGSASQRSASLAPAAGWCVGSSLTVTPARAPCWRGRWPMRGAYPGALRGLSWCLCRCTGRGGVGEGSIRRSGSPRGWGSDWGFASRGERWHVFERLGRRATHGCSPGPRTSGGLSWFEVPPGSSRATCCSWTMSGPAARQPGHAPSSCGVRARRRSRYWSLVVAEPLGVAAHALRNAQAAAPSEVK